MVLPPDASLPTSEVCPFCGLAHEGHPNRCPRCGQLLGDAAEDLKRLGEESRKALRARKALADGFFLAGLLVGGPLVSLLGHASTGIFVVLGGALASVLRRYTEWSTPGTVAVGALGAALTASFVIEPARSAVEQTLATEHARAAYVASLGKQGPEFIAEPRGPSLVAVWFTVPIETAGTCGSFPPQEIRQHLADLGFLRVVVESKNSAGGLCSFPP